MKNRDKVIIGIYSLIALGALVATWSQNIAFFRLPDNGGIAGFVRGGYVNPAAASLTNDLIFIALAAIVWMVIEARRLKVSHVWVYVVLSFVVAISVSFPLFLIARQLRLATDRS